jgi:membrane protein DedA with SNARE-associated domain
MDFDAIRQWALAFIEAHKAWMPLIAGLLAFCESVAFLSFLVPATVILLALGPMIALRGARRSLGRLALL